MFTGVSFVVSYQLFFSTFVVSFIVFLPFVHRLFKFTFVAIFNRLFSGNYCCIFIGLSTANFVSRGYNIPHDTLDAMTWLTHTLYKTKRPNHIHWLIGLRSSLGLVVLASNTAVTLNHSRWCRLRGKVLPSICCCSLVIDFVNCTFCTFNQVTVPMLIMPAGDDPDHTPLKEVLDTKPFGDKCEYRRFDDMHHGFCSAR